MRRSGVANLFSLLAIVALMNIPAAMGTLRVSDSARAAVRSGTGGRGAEVGLDNLLRLDVSLAWPTTELFVGYGPRLGLAKEIEASREPWRLTFLHDLDAGITWSQPRYTLTLRQSFSIGTQSFGQVFAVSDDVAAMPPGAIPPPGTAPTTPGMTPAPADVPTGSGAPIPLDSSVPVWSASSSVALTYLYSERWQSNFDASFGTSGGNGDAAEQTLPRLQTFDAGASLTHDLTRLHRLGGVLRGQRGGSVATDYWLASLAATWAILFSPETDLSLSAGAGYRDTNDETGRSTQSVVPVGSASLTHEVAMRGSRARYGFTIAYEPSVDTLRAQLQDRLSASASAGLASTTSSVTLSVNGSQSFPTSEPDAARFVGLSLALNHRFAELIGVELGGQIADQNVADGAASGDNGTVWIVYLGVGAQLDPLRF